MESLLITTVFRNNNTVFLELTKLASKYECHISCCNLFTVGLDNIVNMQIAGNWSSIAKIEAALPTLAKKLEIELLFKRSHSEKIDRYSLPYRIELIAIDQPGIIYEIINFLCSLDIHLQNLEVRSSKHEQTPLIRLKIQVDLPAENNIADIREHFLLFCDELNLDGTLEPKNNF